MPITESAKKAQRQSQKRKKHNLLYKKKIKKLDKEIRSLLSQKKQSEAKKLLNTYFKAVDKAAKENVIKKNNGSRKKSKMSLLTKGGVTN